MTVHSGLGNPNLSLILPANYRLLSGVGCPHGDFDTLTEFSLSL
jgi:hypothetical protein